MIKISFFRKADNGSIHFTAKGHAASAPKGEDLVCAAATMLAYTLAQTVQFLWEEGKLKRKPKLSLSDGDATIIATPTEEGYAETLHSFFVVQCGAHILAHNYPKLVQLEHFTGDRA